MNIYVFLSERAPATMAPPHSSPANVMATATVGLILCVCVDVMVVLAVQSFLSHNKINRCLAPLSRAQMWKMQPRPAHYGHVLNVNRIAYKIQELHYNMVSFNYMISKMKYFAHNIISFGGFRAFHFLLGQVCLVAN